MNKYKTCIHVVSGYHITELPSEWPSAVQSCPVLHMIIHSDRNKGSAGWLHKFQ